MVRSNARKNGVHSTNAMMMFTTIKASARQSPLVVSQAAITDGMAPGSQTAVRATSPYDSNRKVSVPSTSGMPMNGITKPGFMTMGMPKISGSLTLAMLGSSDASANRR